ncbi:MAG: sensor domain-containing diguanylate cyclase, partial [Janthinobacterium lividum]
MRFSRLPSLRLRTLLLRYPVAIVGGTVLLTLSMLALFTHIVLQERQSLSDHAIAQADNLGMLVEREVTRTFQQVDLSLQAVVENALDPVVRAMPVTYRRNLLFDRATTAGRYLGSMLYIDAKGDIVDDSNVAGTRHANFADRDWFKVHKARDDEGLFISAPYFSRLRDGAHSIALSRRINHPDGSFAGVAIAAIKLDYFTALLDGVTLGSLGAMTLLKEDGTVLMYPGNNALIGKNVKTSVNFARFMRHREHAFYGYSAIDNVRRLFVFRKFAELPMVMSIAPSEQDIFLSWQRQTRYTAVFVVLLATALIALSVFLSATFKSRLRIEAELRQLSGTDSLTGLSNRRTLDQAIRDEWSRARRTNLPLSVLFIDIDRFKAYNDTYGHHHGDTTLAAVAGAIASCSLRPSDVVARFGGEEFVVLLPATDGPGAGHLAAAIHGAVEKLDITHKASEFHHVTVSIGIATS